MIKQFAVIKSRIKVFIAGGLYLVAKFFNAHLGSCFNGKTRVLVFHHIDAVARFRSIILVLKRRYNLISFDQYLCGEKAKNRINIIIALDDGYRSWYCNALPVFLEFGVKPMLFIDSKFICQNGVAAADYCHTAITTWPEASLSWAEIKELVSMGAEIGGHTSGHINLTNCSSEESMVEVINCDRETICREIGRSIRIFTYPFGRYDDRVIRAMSKTVYGYAFSSDSGFLEESQGNFLLKRSNIGLRPPLVVCAMVEGWVDRVAAAARLLKGIICNRCYLNTIGRLKK